MKKKILHIIGSTGFAGAENMAMSIISNLSSEYDFAYVSPQGSIEKELVSRSIEHMPIEKLSIIEIRRIVKKWRPDVIHSHDFNATIKSVLASRNIPVVAHIHQNPAWLKRLNLFSILFFIVCFKVNKIIVVSPALKKSGYLFNIFDRKTIVINNIVDVKLINEKASILSKKKYDIAFIGRFEDVKDPLRFINIVKKVVEKVPQIKVVMMGGGSLMEKCISSIEENDLSNNIDITGFTSNPFPVLKNTKILVMTSKSEGMPMVIIEALTMGKPVVVPQLDGIESLVDRSCGIICSNDTDFILGIKELIESSEKYAEMSLNAKEKGAIISDMSKFRNQFKLVYNNVE